jgi:hypothetical protein
VCRGLEGRELEKMKPHQHCIDDAIGGAVVRVNHPQFYCATHNIAKALPRVSGWSQSNGQLRISRR